MERTCMKMIFLVVVINLLISAKVSAAPLVASKGNETELKTDEKLDLISTPATVVPDAGIQLVITSEIGQLHPVDSIYKGKRINGYSKKIRRENRLSLFSFSPKEEDKLKESWEPTVSVSTTANTSDQIEQVPGQYPESGNPDQISVLQPDLSKMIQSGKRFANPSPYGGTARHARFRRSLASAGIIGRTGNEDSGSRSPPVLPLEVNFEGAIQDKEREIKNGGDQRATGRKRRCFWPFVSGYYDYYDYGYGYGGGPGLPPPGPPGPWGTPYYKSLPASSDSSSRQ